MSWLRFQVLQNFFHVYSFLAMSCWPRITDSSKAKTFLTPGGYCILLWTYNVPNNRIMAVGQGTLLNLRTTMPSKAIIKGSGRHCNSPEPTRHGYRLSSTAFSIDSPSYKGKKKLELSVIFITVLSLIISLLGPEDSVAISMLMSLYQCDMIDYCKSITVKQHHCIIPNSIHTSHIFRTRSSFAVLSFNSNCIIIKSDVQLPIANKSANKDKRN